MKGGETMSNTFLRVEEVAEEMGVSKSYAYKIVQRVKCRTERKRHFDHLRASEQKVFYGAPPATVQKGRSKRHWQFIRNRKPTLGGSFIGTQIGTENESNPRSVAFRQNERHKAGSGSSLTNWVLIWI